MQILTSDDEVCKEWNEGKENLSTLLVAFRENSKILVCLKISPDALRLSLFLKLYLCV